ncbi:hypothetical protein MIND_01323300 [Mycena indigotica]|uniref:MYND-type domain-containing protein n=1 Tax=Mycena indigotica TaxID=2126181 RepID=A0A8H6VSY5_9AGAR|nr:uncharacterized protein MIND_01323300 [Mycena indigotica]KAF7290821.1 hypothetical protein MIND_01323300 [Mycena indigotica]
MASSEEYKSDLSDEYDDDDSFEEQTDSDEPPDREAYWATTRFGPRGPPPHFGPGHSPKIRGDSNLRNPHCFPSYNHCPDYRTYWPQDEVVPPPHHHWCFLGQILNFKDKVLVVSDTAGNNVFVCLYFSNTTELFDWSTLKSGSTIAVLYAEQRYYDPDEDSDDEQLQKRILLLHHPQFVKIYPCSLETLLRINDDIEAETPEDRLQKCQGCGKDDGPNKLTLRRCSRCMSVSYCSSECQVAAWKRGHKSECKVFAAVTELKLSRYWRNEYPVEWVAFGQREKAMIEREEWRNNAVAVIKPEWRTAEPLVPVKLVGTFEVSSGELVWGQLASILEGIKNPASDQPGEDKASVDNGGTVYTQGWTFRALAKTGVWKIAKVDGFGLPDRPKDTWIAYHSSYSSPAELLSMTRDIDWGNRMENPRVCWVNRYDWGSQCSNSSGAARMFAALDPGSAWPVAVERKKRRWQYAHNNTFLLDAKYAAGLLRTIARPSLLDENLSKGEGSSFLGGETVVGCHLPITKSEYEFARMIFSEEDSVSVPGKKELVAFWYERDNMYHYEEALGEPTYEDVV